MTRARRRFVTAVAIAVVLWTDDSDAEPIRTLSPSVCTTAGGSRLELAPSVVLTHDEWDRLDTALRRSQDSETRLRAENESLRATAPSGRGWWFVAGALLGIGGAAYAFHR